jgi:lipopolysaccharide/colanic/teichoic acid biosynthesis glycosyltransferase
MIPRMEHKTGPSKTPSLTGGLPLYLPLKAAIDWACALALLVAAAPIMTLVGLAVAATSRGPIFYSQMRLGQGGTPFRIYKFRTMRHRCEASSGPVWSIANDPRATPIGGWLRNTHLDELPQLWNVLRGDMSLIGPRPERPEIAAKIEQLLPEFRQRLCIRPGLSGLAQVLMPPDTDLQTVQNKLAHDQEYIRHLGLLLDVRIGLATVLCLAGFKTRVTGWLVRDFTPPPLTLRLEQQLPQMTAASLAHSPPPARKPLAA